MNTKKLIVFLLFAFLPMVAVGLIMHFTGASTVRADAGPASVDPMAALKAVAFGAGAMFIPLLAVIFTQLIFREPVLRGVGIDFKFNRWWVIGWLLMPLFALAVMGVTLLMPGAQWTPDGEAVQAAGAALPVNIGVWGIIAITMVSGLIAGITINALFAFGEEVAWRGFLMKLFEGRKFLVAVLWIGVIWGLWHAPIILNGHNYPQHPVAGVFMMVGLCLLMTPMLVYFRQKGGSVIVAAIVHGTLNAVAGASAVAIPATNDLLYGAAGLAGFIVLLLIDLGLFLYDRYISRERLFTSALHL